MLRMLRLKRDMHRSLRTETMHSNKSTTRNLASLHLLPSGDDALRTSFSAIAESCERQPDIFYASRHGVRSPWRVLMRCFVDAFEAARTPAARRTVVERVNAFLDECAAYVRGWVLDGSPLDRRDVFETAQDADGDEDVAETIYLMNPCRATAMGLIEAGRLDRERSTQRETYLLRSTDPRPAA